jgi:hypothetical protein
MGAARGLASGIQRSPILKIANGLTGGQIGGALTVLGGGNPLKGTPLDPDNPLGANGALDPSGAFKQPAPQAAPIQNPLAPDTLSKGQGSIDTAMGGQQGLLAALAGQGGLQKQGMVFNGLGTLSSDLGNANGVGTQQQAKGMLQDVYGGQGNTVGQLQDIANGVGPNPAQAMLRQQTGQNVANQAALMAGQRGAGANIGLMARQNAQLGGNLQQQAVGQGATMQANQSLNALNNIGGQQAAMGNTANALGGLGTTQVGNQLSTLGQAGAQANTMAGQQIGQTNQNATTALANQGQNLGAAGNFTQAQVGNQASINAANAAQAVQGQKAKADILGGAMNGLGAAGIAAMADGGPVGGFNMTAPQAPQGLGPVTAPPVTSSPTQGYLAGNTSTADYLKPDPTSGMSDWGSFISNLQKPGNPNDSELKQGSTQMGKLAGAGAASAFMAGGGLSSQGGNVRASSPSQKAEVKGNSYANDKVPAMLSEGEIVIPRSVLQGKDPARGAADFVAKVLAKRGRK